MARSRNIKPGFFTNDALVELSFEVRLLFIGLWTLADREGRLEDRPKRIKMEIFPADSVDVDAGLRQLESAAFLERYEVGGVRIVQIVNFAKHQNPHQREAASQLPEKPSTTKAVPDPGQGDAEDVTSPADSPLLIPDPPSLIPSVAHTAADLSIAMRSGGIESQSADPRLIALAEQGVTPETIRAACAEAKQAKPGERIRPGYVFAILETWAKRAAEIDARGAQRPPPRAPPASRHSATIAALTGRTNQEYVDVESRTVPTLAAGNG